MCDEKYNIFSVKPLRNSVFHIISYWARFCFPRVYLFIQNFIYKYGTNEQI